MRHSLAALLALAASGCGCPCDVESMARARAGDGAIDCGDFAGLIGADSCTSRALAAGHGAYVHFAESEAANVYVVERAGRAWILRERLDPSTQCPRVRVEECTGGGVAYEGTLSCVYDHYFLEAECQ